MYFTLTIEILQHLIVSDLTHAIVVPFVAKK
jgi:hypothetical protein